MKNIAGKELNYINDFLSWELLAAKKCFQYASQETNQAHKQLFYDAAGVHQQNYTNILNYVSNFKNQGGKTH